MSRFLTTCLLSLFLVGPALGDLTPVQVAILANSSSRESLALATYYAKQRGIPLENICKVPMPTDETLPGAEWSGTIRPAIREWISQGNRQNLIRCMVTVWHVPLRITGTPDPTRGVRVGFLSAERDKRLKQIDDALKSIEALAPEEYERLKQLQMETEAEAAKDKPIDETAAPTPPQSEVEKLRAELQKSISRGQSAAQLVDEATRVKLLQQLEFVVRRTAGEAALGNTLAQTLQAMGNATTKEMLGNFHFLRGRVNALTDIRLLVEAQPYNANRDILAIDLVTRQLGLLGSVEWIDQQNEYLRVAQTSSSFDSELSLLRWDDYATTRWQPNYLNQRFAETSLPENHPTLMVARIDAPTLKLAKGLIDTAIQVEKTGLTGEVYLDARGISKDPQKNSQEGSYEDFDKALVLAEEALEATGQLPVTLDRTPALFQPGQCKNAALYCGWYSVAKYVDAFDWNPGAVAYHLASSEATTLKKPESQVWCKRLLEDGVCATIGPVFEPYLISFPRPNEFFPALMSGETLVESYYKTKPFNSWMMVLIGDPLYRPFKKSA